MISASALDRIDACPVSETLPHADQVNEWQERGNAVHDFLYRVTVVGRDEALDEAPEQWRETCESIDLSRLPACDPESWAGEVAFAYDTLTDTAREIGRGIGRDYGELLPTEIPGSVDVTGLAGDCAVVVDYKGRWSDAPPASVNRQVRFYALCACRIWNKPSARVGICRVGDDGSVHWDWATFDGFELDEIANEVCATFGKVERVKAEGGQAVIGPHCRWCPALAYCPAQTRLALALGAGDSLTVMSQAPNEGDVESVIGSMLTAENAAQAWHRLKAAKKLLERIDETIRAFAGQHPIDIGNGKILGAHTTKRDSIDAAVAHEVLVSRFGKVPARDAVKMTTSKAAIDRAIKPLAEQMGKPRAPIKREVLKAIEEAGGVRTSRKTSVVEFTVKEGV